MCLLRLTNAFLLSLPFFTRFSNPYEPTQGGQYEDAGPTFPFVRSAANADASTAAAHSTGSSPYRDGNGGPAGGGGGGRFRRPIPNNFNPDVRGGGSNSLNVGGAGIASSSGESIDLRL